MVIGLGEEEDPFLANVKENNKEATAQNTGVEGENTLAKRNLTLG